MDPSTKREALQYLTVWALLMALLGLTVGAHYVVTGAWKVVANLGIGTIKAGLIAWYFMHLARSGGLVRLVAIIGPLWLALLIGLSLADYLTRQGPQWPW